MNVFGGEDCKVPIEAWEGAMSSMNGKDLLQKAHDLSAQIVEYRRTIHQHPELSYQEHETSAFVAARLGEMSGLEVKDRVFGTGVVGLLRGKHEGRTVALRADIDALPVDEANDVAYKSIFEHRMHACGHDGHIAMLLGVARILSSVRDSMAGNVKFIFQPAEEVPPEGGAKGMIAEGVLDNPPVDAIFAAHIWPDIPVGEVALKDGPIMAEADRFELILRGKGGHAAFPDRVVDTMLMSSQVVVALHTLVSRRIDPLKPVVLSICKCNGGTAYNILPDEVKLEGTTRYFKSGLGKLLQKEMEQIVQGICQCYRGSYELNYEHGFLPVINDPAMTLLVAKSAGEVLGENMVHWVEVPSMTGEDFSFFLEKVPGCYFWLGTGNPAKGIDGPLHSSKYQLDEDVLSLGTAVLAQIAIDFLNG